MKKEVTDKYKVVITTNTFATTFENDLCSYVTGQIGQCNTGVEHRFKADEEVRAMFEKVIERRICADDYFRPVYSSLDDSNALEIFFNSKPTLEMMDIIKRGCEEFATEQKKKFPITTKIVFEEFKIVNVRTTVEFIEEVYTPLETV